MSAELFLVILLLTGIIANSSLIALSSCLILLIKLAGADILLLLIQNYGIDIGLLFLLLSILIPVASEKISSGLSMKSLCCLTGFLAVLGGALATNLNSAGIDLLQMHPELIIGLLIGQIIGIVVFKGLPTGPVMSAGIAAILLWLISLF